jgi:hypothetical protein
MWGKCLVAVLAALAALAYCQGAVRPSAHMNSFKDKQKFDIRVYVSSDSSVYKFLPTSDHDLLWEHKGIEYAPNDGAVDKEVTYNISTSILNQNATRLFAHVFVTKAGHFPDAATAKARDLKFDSMASSYKRVSLVRWKERRKSIGLHNLITKERAPWEVVLDSVEEEEKAKYVAYWLPTLHVSVVHMPESYELGKIPNLLGHFLMGYSVSGKDEFIDPFYNQPTAAFVPVVYLNELALTENQLVALNATTDPTLALEVRYSPLTISRFEWMLNLLNSFKMQEEKLGISEKESEDLRGMFINTNPVLLYTTIGISALHLIFDALAFKNEVSFYRSLESMEGLSARSVVLQVEQIRPSNAH